MSVGAKDKLDKALVRQYANARTNIIVEEKINADEMWKKINMMAMSSKVHSDLRNTMHIQKPVVNLRGFWDKK